MNVHRIRSLSRLVCARVAPGWLFVLTWGAGVGMAQGATWTASHDPAPSSSLAPHSILAPTDPPVPQRRTPPLVHGETPIPSSASSLGSRMRLTTAAAPPPTNRTDMRVTACGLWSALAPDLAPIEAYGHVLVYDSSRDRWVMFGG